MQSKKSDFYYPYGFTTEVEKETIRKGLNESIIRLISAKREEPSWVIDFRLRALKAFQEMKEPTWAELDYEPIDYQNLRYFSAPKKRPKYDSFDEVDPKILETFEKLGVPSEERARLLNVNVATDFVFDSVSVGTSFKEKLLKEGILFCSISEACRKYGDIVQKYLGSVVSYDDNFFAALNGAVFSDGSFVFVPKGVKAPMELSSYFRINDYESGQFERTLIIAEEGASLSYLEGCTAPAHHSSQLHAAVVELVALDKAHIKYSTVQNWYPGDPETQKGGIYNFVTKRGLCQGKESKISWTQIEAGSKVTWKYPSCVLKGEGSVGEFYSVSVTSGHMQADTGTKMIHLGENTRSTIISKGIAAGHSNQRFRSLVKVLPSAKKSRNFTQCDSLLTSKQSAAHTYPMIDTREGSAIIEHEATTSKLSEEQLFYLQSRGFSFEEAIKLILTGYCQSVFTELPLEFAREAQHLIALKIEEGNG